MDRKSEKEVLSGLETKAQDSLMGKSWKLSAWKTKGFKHTVL